MRSKSAKINLVTNLILQILTLMFGLLLPQRIIKFYGSDFNGLISSIRTVISSFGIVEAGVTLVVLASLYSPIKSGNRKLVNNILSSAKRSFKRSAFIYLPLLLFLIIIYSFLSETIHNRFQIAILILAIGISTFWDLLIGAKYSVLIRGHNKEYIVSLIQIFVTMINLFIVFVLFNGKISLIVSFSALSLSYFLRPALLYIYVKNRYDYNYDTINNNFKLSQQKSSFVHQIANIIFVNTDIVLITIFFSFEMVSVYSVYMIVFLGITRILSIFTSGLQPGFGQLISEKNVPKLNKTYSAYEFIYYNLAGIVYVTCLLTISEFIDIYIGNSANINYQFFSLALMLVIAEFLSKIRIPANTLVIAGGYFDKTKNSAIIEVILNLILSFVGIIIFGFYGVILGTIVSMLYRVIYFSYFVSKNIIHRNARFTLIKIFRTVVISIIAYFTANSIFKFNVNSIISWLIFASLNFTLASLIYMIFNFIFDRNETILNIKYIIKILGIKMKRI